MPIDFKVQLTHVEKIAVARGLAVKKLPYFSAALYSLMPRALPGMFEMVGAGMGVSARGIMHYDPRVVEEEWTIDDVLFGLLHEVGHLLRDHATRADENAYDRKLWNLAGDAAINDDLVAAGLKPLPTDMLPSKINDRNGTPMKDFLPEEAYYSALRQQKNQQGGGGASNDQSSSNDPSQGGQGSGKQKTPRPGNGNCGGCAGHHHDALPGDGPISTLKEGRSDVELDRVRKAVANAIQKHQEQHGRGSVPGGWLVWSEQTLTPPQIRWQDKLRRATRSGIAKIRGMVDFHYARPSRRQHAMGYGAGTPILPSMFSPTPRVGVFVDTSGSMGRDDLEIAMPEVDGVIKATGAEVLFGVCDAQLHGKIEKVRSAKEACKKLIGGGGTNFVPVFEELARMPKHLRPNLIIFITDGDGPAPSAPPPGMIVVWVLVGRHARVPYDESYKQITWGEQIILPSLARAA